MNEMSESINIISQTINKLSLFNSISYLNQYKTPNINSKLQILPHLLLNFTKKNQ